MKIWTEKCWNSEILERIWSRLLQYETSLINKTRNTRCIQLSSSTTSFQNVFNRFKRSPHLVHSYINWHIITYWNYCYYFSFVIYFTLSSSIHPISSDRQNSATNTCNIDWGIEAQTLRYEITFQIEGWLSPYPFLREYNNDCVWQYSLF